MKWFKCFCDNHRGRTVNKLLDEVGHSGALIYYFIMELCVEKFEIERGAIASESDCVFTFNRRVIVSVARAKWPTVARVLAIGAECTVWEWKANGNEIEIKFPMLLDLLDKEAKRPRKKRERAAKKSRLDKDKDKEEDREYIKRARTPAVCNSDFKNYVAEHLTFLDQDELSYFKTGSKKALDYILQRFDINDIQRYFNQLVEYNLNNPKKAKKDFPMTLRNWMDKGKQEGKLSYKESYIGGQINDVLKGAFCD
jgi:hypothetical protein